MKFHDGMIERRRLSADVFGLLHDLCYADPNLPVEEYRDRAKVLLKSRRPLTHKEQCVLLRRVKLKILRNGEYW